MPQISFLEEDSGTQKFNVYYRKHAVLFFIVYHKGFFIKNIQRKEI